MATKVHMEALSPTMEEGQVVKWLKSEGDKVASGDVLAEIETDKATMELVARGEGILQKILLEEGGTAAVGALIGVIGEDGEDLSDFVAEEEEDDAPSAEAESAETEASAEPAPDEDAEESAEEREAPRAERDGRVKASPLARRLAEEEGLDLSSIEGSGPGGRVVKRDVEKAVDEGVTPAPSPTTAPDSEEDYVDVSLSQMRKTIAKRLVESIGPIPHFFLTVDVDMSRTVQARARINKQLEKDGFKVSFNDIVLKATAMALRKHPECNAHWLGDAVRQFNRVHLAVAVAIEDGLITPVVRDADRKGLVEISTEVRELAGRAREKKLKPEEYSGGTFSVSNLGMFGVEDFTAVINPPEAGILAVGALEERAVVKDGEVVVEHRMKITMSCDHRVIDGALGAQFLQTLTGILEEPLAALI